jgi:hypothetical protein
MTRSILHGCFIFFLVVVAMSLGCTRAPSGSEPASKPEATAIRVSPEGIQAAEPAIAGDANGAFVVYVAHSEDGADVFVQSIDKTGKLMNQKVRVNPNADEAKAWKGDPPTIALGSDGAVYIGWTRAVKDAKGTDLVLSVSDDGGRTFTAPVKINDDLKPASHGMHSLAVDANGNVHAAWLDERNIKFDHHAMKSGEAAEPNSEVFYSVSHDAGKTFEPNQKIAVEVCPCCKTSLLAASDGTIYLSWRQVLNGDLRHIAVASSKDGGQNFSEGTIVSDDRWEIHACPVSGAAMASPEPDILEVLWYTHGTAGPPGMYWARSSDRGKTFGPRKLMDDEMIGGTPVLIRTQGMATAVFTDSDGMITKSIWNGSGLNDLTTSAITKGSVPSSVYSNEKLLTAFTQNTSGKSEVWLSID